MSTPIEKSKLVEGYLDQLRPMLLHAVGEIVNKENANVVMTTRELPDADFHLSLVLSIHDPSTVAIGELIQSFDSRTLE